MDLRGFSQQNAGCVFEINEIFNLVALQHVVFVVDETTDQSFMRQTMQHAWQRIKELSPNRRPGAGQVSLVQLTLSDGIRDLLFSVCGAATAKPEQAGVEPLTHESADRSFSW
jgi:hypothetical protein